MQQIYVVPHTHWDREWYFTVEQSQVLLLEALPVILAALEDGSLPCFVLDGQSVMLADYLELMPQEIPRIKSLVGAGKLLVGPWYTQTDQCVVGAESMVRNLLYGTRDCAPFGGHMAIGYVPDSFGQTEQLPQLFNQFGIKYAVFWRGLWEGISPKTEFNWQSKDGSEVITAVIQNGYSGMKGMPDDAEFNGTGLKDIKRLIAGVESFNHGNNSLIMAGNDQQPWDPRLPALLAKENTQQKKYLYKLASISDFFDALQQGELLQNVSGEMLAGKYSRTHRGIYSTRYDIKKANANIENLITNQLEPLLSISWSMGMSYPHGLIEKIWKTIMQSHAHDSIGCCNTDPVNTAVKQRFSASMALCRQQLDLRQRQICQCIFPSIEGEKLVLFNTLPQSRNEFVSIDIVVPESACDAFSIVNNQGQAQQLQVLTVNAVKLSSLVQDLGAALKPGQTGDPILYRYELLIDAGELPALGYKTLYIQHNSDVSTSLKQAEIIDVNSAVADMSNDKLNVSLADGTLTIVNRQTGQTLSGLLELVDGGDDGDNYDFSPPQQDWLISTKGQQPKVRMQQGRLASIMWLKYNLLLPADLSEREKRSASVNLPISICLTLTAGAEFVDVKVSLDNTVTDHRLQAVFRTGISTDVSYADQPFGTIMRASHPPELDEWKTQQWTSKPLPLYPMQSFAALNDGNEGLAVITNGIREYEVSMENTSDLAITLFRGIGALGKPDLVYRPGRLSGMPTLTPDSQLLGDLSFHFALFPHQGDVASAGVARLAKQFLSPVESFHNSGFNRFSINSAQQNLADEYSLLRLDSELVVSAVKKAEDSEAIIIRMFNPSFSAQDIGSIPLRLLTGDAYRSTMAETRGEKLANLAQLGTAKPQQVITLLVEKN
jgi:mannosylglycerate hydrolase